MKSYSRMLLAAAVTSGLCCGVGLVQAGLSNSGPTVQRLDYHYPHMHHALDELQAARNELDEAEDIFRGHKAEAMDHVDHAIQEVRNGLREQHDDSVSPADLPSVQNLGEDYPHMRRALDHLRTARGELDSADHVFSGHRERAMDETDHAIHQLEDALHG